MSRSTATEAGERPASGAFYSVDGTYNFGYLDEQSKRMIRRSILKAVAVPGYQVPFGGREMPLPYGCALAASRSPRRCSAPTTC